MSQQKQTELWVFVIARPSVDNLLILKGQKKRLCLRSICRHGVFPLLGVRMRGHGTRSCPHVSEAANNRTLSRHPSSAGGGAARGSRRHERRTYTQEGRRPAPACASPEHGCTEMHRPPQGAGAAETLCRSDTLKRRP